MILGFEKQHLRVHRSGADIPRALSQVRVMPWTLSQSCPTLCRYLTPDRQRSIAGESDALLSHFRPTTLDNHARISGIISREMPEMTCVWCGRGRAHVKRIHRERAVAGQVQMSDAGSNALVEVPIGNMPRGHLLFHNAAAWSIRCTFTSLLHSSRLPSILRRFSPW